jgi:hypothetical protein
MFLAQQEISSPSPSVFESDSYFFPFLVLILPGFSFFLTPALSSIGIFLRGIFRAGEGEK